MQADAGSDLAGSASCRASAATGCGAANCQNNSAATQAQPARAIAQASSGSMCGTTRRAPADGRESFDIGKRWWPGVPWGTVMEARKRPASICQRPRIPHRHGKWIGAAALGCAWIAWAATRYRSKGR
jgi:hypothetical protein